MGKHKDNATSSGDDRAAGGNKLGKHVKGFSKKEDAADMLDRLAKERGRLPKGDLSSMDEGPDNA